MATWERNNGSYVAWDQPDPEVSIWSIKFEGENGPEWTQLYLEVAPSEFWGEDDPSHIDAQWDWFLGVSECCFEWGSASTAATAKAACEAAARGLADEVREE
jgi:hypothetical protein